MPEPVLNLSSSILRWRGFSANCTIPVATFFDRLAKKRCISHANNALVYGDPETSFVDSQPQMGEAEIREAARPRWGQSVVLWLIVLLAIYAYRANFVSDTTALKPPTITAPSHNKSLLAKPDTPIPSAVAPSPTQIPQFQMPMFGIRVGHEVVSKTTLEQLQKIVREYHVTHTHKMDDLFVCNVEPVAVNLICSLACELRRRPL
jgi:hypothetical protein